RRRSLLSSGWRWPSHSSNWRVALTTFIAWHNSERTGRSQRKGLGECADLSRRKGDESLVRILVHQELLQPARGSLVRDPPALVAMAKGLRGGINGQTQQKEHPRRTRHGVQPETAFSK